MAETRKLAAILAADVAGYSKLAAADEERTLARLRALRSDLFDPTIALHHGRVVKRTGDGVLVEFRSVVDAVRCAIEVQNGMADRNAGLPPEQRIEFRVGIHLGDVVEESDGDLMGDGVNIAARLEGIAKPGAICLSEDAYRQVKSRLDLAVSDLGSTQLKNIAEPVHVYSVEVGKPARTKPTKSGEKHGWLLALPQSATAVATANAYGITLDRVWADWAAQHGVSETIATALCLLARSSKAGEVALKLTPSCPGTERFARGRPGMEVLGGGVGSSPDAIHCEQPSHARCELGPGCVQLPKAMRSGPPISGDGARDRCRPTLA
jgi:adenylate cyclase